MLVFVRNSTNCVRYAKMRSLHSSWNSLENGKQGPLQWFKRIKCELCTNHHCLLYFHIFLHQWMYPTYSKHSPWCLCVCVRFLFALLFVCYSIRSLQFTKWDSRMKIIKIEKVEKKMSIAYKQCNAMTWNGRCWRRCKDAFHINNKKWTNKL